jgi:hypothetical protein
MLVPECARSTDTDCVDGRGGVQFCWVCLQPWSQKCGFYRCATQPTAEASAEVCTVALQTGIHTVYAHPLGPPVADRPTHHHHHPLADQDARRHGQGTVSLRPSVRRI